MPWQEEDEDGMKWEEDRVKDDFFQVTLKSSAFNVKDKSIPGTADNVT